MEESVVIPEYKSTKDEQELKEVQSKYQYTDTELRTVSFNEDMTGNLGDIGDLKFTESGFKSILKLLKIPSAFVKKIDYPTFMYNVEQLKTQYNVPIKYVTRDNTVVNAVSIAGKKSHFQIVDSTEILEYFRGDNFRLVDYRVGDNGASMDIIHNNLSHINVDKLGRIDFGYRIENPFTLNSDKMVANLFAQQLVCENGMVISKNLMNSKVDLRKLLEDEQQYVDTLKNNLDNNIGKFYTAKNMIKTFEGMANTKIKYKFLKPIMSKVKGINDNFFKSIFGYDPSVDKDDVQYFRDKFNNEEYNASDFLYFDVMYNITDKCKTLPLIDRQNLEDYSSTLIKYHDHQLELK